MANETKQELFDLEAVYDTEIFPLMEQILAICKRERMPMFASFAYRVTEDGTSKCTSHLNFPERLIPAFHEAEQVVRRGPAFLAMTITSGARRG